MNEEPNAADVRRWEDKRELFLRAAQNLLAHEAAGRKCDPEGLTWARHIVATVKPLGRPLDAEKA